MTAILLNRNCNKQCEYCGVWKKENTAYELTESVLENIKCVIDFSLKTDKRGLISLTGGEPGLVDKNKLTKLFEIIPNGKALVFTNGVFIKNNYHKLYESKISKLIIHITDDEEDLPINNINCDHEYIYVVTKKSIPTLEEFAKKYQSINIKLILYEDVYTPNNEFFLEDDDIKLLQFICKKTNNLFLQNYETKSINKPNILKNLLKMCRDRTHDVFIDLPRNEILHCCLAKKGIPFNSENFKGLVLGTIDKDLLGLTNCDTCSRIKNNDIVLINKIINTNILIRTGKFDGN